ncbi:hypothetical protein BANRA_04075 [Pseudomonas aeruginosa]|nr:amino acid ABC transporter substrate-binding protein [Pseudomonas aeruginosa]VCZ00509.1 hypothetical protein BANRA_04075 [Pseudomonas aeruginosa]
MSFRCSPCRLAGILLAALFVPGLAAAAGSCERLVATGNPEYPPTCGATRRIRSA